MQEYLCMHICFDCVESDENENTCVHLTFRKL